MIRGILEAYRKGKINEEEAEIKILRVFYEGSESFLLDLYREKRTGFPEVIFAEGKNDEHLVEIAKKVLEKKGLVVISNVDTKKEAILKDTFSDFKIRKAGRVLVIKRSDYCMSKLHGIVGVITAGTADIPYAEECALILEEFGIKVIRSYDSGVAGIHRVLLSLKKMKGVDLLIVFAGMDGVLPTLIASLTDLPIIAVPTPVGYGVGEKGEGALVTMLQSCVPGVLVVNIGNTIGAAAGAIRILKAMARGNHGKNRKNKESNQE